MKRVHKITLNALVRSNFRCEVADVENVMSQILYDGEIDRVKLRERRVRRWLAKLVKEGLAEQHDQGDNLRVYNVTKRGRRKYDLHLGSL